MSPGVQTVAQLAPKLRTLYDEGRRAHPAVAVGERLFSDRVIERLPLASDAAEALSALHAGDFYLVCGCLASDAGALEALEALIASASNALARMLGSTALVDDALQLLRQKLLAPPDGELAGIAEYSGRGPLKRWIRVVATRVALDLKRSEKRHLPAEESVGDLRASGFASPELTLFKKQERPRFEAALRSALASLDSRSRNVLRLQVVDALSLDAIGRFYGVNKSTVSRWVQTARAEVTRHLRRALERDLALKGRDLHSYVGLFGSGLDTSLSQLLER